MILPATHRILLTSAPQDRRLLLIATSSLRPVLTDLGLSEIFDAELRVPPISKLRHLTHILKEVELFRSEGELRNAVAMLEQAGFGGEEDESTSRLNIGIKKLLSIVEMARQEPQASAERLTSALMGLGI